ncbi:MULTISPECIES: hypothetical protein [unclassified Haladaptatus]|uniref:hypothetical protein n=1 Tax=unclassified Haladaptatus TaxID=2622732 RepID=UPI0023E7D891|nr:MULTISPECIES: hypothetical protein [unclassified Haladaptatus]
MRGTQQSPTHPPESTTASPDIDYLIDWDADTQGRIHVTLPRWRRFGAYLESHLFEWGESVGDTVEVHYVKSIHRNGQTTRIYRDPDIVAALQRERNVVVSW